MPNSLMLSKAIPVSFGMLQMTKMHLHCHSILKWKTFKLVEKSLIRTSLGRIDGTRPIRTSLCYYSPPYGYQRTMTVII